MPEAAMAREGSKVPRYEPLHSSEAVLASILASSKDCIKILDLDGSLLFLSEFGQKTLGISDMQPFLGACWMSFWSGPDRELAERAVAEARAGKTGRFEGFFADLRGEPRWWDVVVTPINGVDGKPEKLLAVSHDLTERKNSEDALRSSEALFRTLANQIPQICYISDKHGQVRWFNDRWYEYTGLSEAESLGEGWKKAHTADTPEQIGEFVAEVIPEGRPFERLHQMRDRRGRLGWFLTRATPIRSESGEIVQWFGTATDVDERVSSEESRKRLVEELKQSNRELNDFAHILSHDLQTHVRSMLSFSQLLTRLGKDKLNAEALSCIDSIEQGARHMHDLIRTVLTYSISSRKPLRCEPVDLNEVVESALAVLAPALEESGAAVVSGPLPAVSGDRVLLQQLLQNLLTNSVKYRSPERPLRVEIHGGWQNSEWVVTVADNGIGVATKDYERIFAPLLRLHDDTIPGTGFGLAVSRRIVERHHGRIWVESELGSGSKFCFTLGASVLPGAIG